uniref:Uncharacterized protein n=1 Tax=Anguilla anguilla TaxID=7936 RepID=A0A0E9VWJ6_ANGAN
MNASLLFSVSSNNDNIQC